MLLQLILLFLTTHPLQSTRIIDSANQDGVLLSDYCPKTEYCPEGTHTMCAYYDPGRVYGPKCANFQNISITPEIAEKLLDLVNEMRGRTSMGIETGHGNVTLPRAYGMFKLKWDNELATFAQILANTCTVRFDLCRATKTFPDPGQLVCVIRFTIPDWLPISNQGKFSEKGLTRAKVEYASQEVCKSWYQEKQHVTLDMLKKKPDWLKQPTRTKGKNYLQLIDGNSTHMGCGISAYVEYHYLGLSGKNIIYNTIHVVCNFSASPRAGTSVYTMTNSNAQECGCPADYEYDDRCLCTDPIVKPIKRTCGKDKNCKPAVVLLPIFTAEDYIPPRADQSSRKSFSEVAASVVDNQPEVMQVESEPEYSFQAPAYKKAELYFGNPSAQHSSLTENQPFETETSKRETGLSYIKHSIGPPYINERINTVENAIDHENPEFSSPFSQQHWHSNADTPFGNGNPIGSQFSSMNHWDPINSSPLSNNGWDSKSRLNYLNKRIDSTRRNAAIRKESIFSKSPKFEIHGSQDDFVKKEPVIKQDVTPRRDFSNIQSVLDNYLVEKKKETLAHSSLAAPHKTVIRPRFRKPVKKPEVENSYFNESVKNTKLLQQNQEFSLQKQHFKNKIYKTTQPKFPVFQNEEYNVQNSNPYTQQDSESPGINDKVDKWHESKKNKNVSHFDEDNIKNINEDSDNKLMTLLDTLEQEVKHIELDHNKKELFDKKIRKIYGSVVGKSESLSQSVANSKSLKSDTDHAIPIDNVFDDPRSFEKEMFDTEDRVNELHTEIRDNYQKPLFDHRQKSIYTKDLVRNREGFDHNTNFINSQNPFISDEEYDSRIPTNNLRKRKRLYNELDKDLNLYEKGSNEINMEKQPVRSVPYNRNLRSRKEMSRSKIHLRNELELDQPRIYIKKDFEKRAQIHPKTHYITPNMPYKRRVSKLHDRKIDLRADDEKGRKLNSLDEPRIRYEEDINGDYIDEKRRNYYDNEEINDQHDFEFEKEYKDEPLLSEDRRNFYQKKLNELERKIQPERRFLNNHDMARERRLIRRQRMQHSLRPNRPKLSSRRRFYLPSRARSTHGFN